MERTKKRLFIPVYLESDVMLLARQVTRNSLRRQSKLSLEYRTLCVDLAAFPINKSNAIFFRESRVIT